MVSKRSMDEKPESKPKGHLKYESMLRAMPQDLVKEMARRRLEEINEFKQIERYQKNE